MIGKLNEAQIETLLNSQFVGRIGVHAKGVTYVVPISYAYDGTSVYAHTYEGMKMDMMRKSPKVCFEVDDTRDMSNWQSVIAWGTFEEINGQEERIKALQVLNSRILPLQSSVTTHLGTAWPFSDDDLSNVDGILFRIRLDQKTGRFESTRQISRAAF